MDYRDRFDLTGKVAIVTGAASGLGHAMARAVAGAGAQAIIADMNADGAEEVASKMRDDGLKAEAHAYDASQDDAAEKLVDAVLAKHGRLDIIFANAGVSAGPGPFTDMGAIDGVDMARWHSVLAINLTGVFNLMRAAAVPMKKQGWGRMILTASTAGLRGDKMVGYAYVATKAGVVNLVRQGAIDLGRYGINVNGIAPGPFITNIGGGRMQQQETQDMFAASVPLGRVAKPEELSGPVLLLASEASSFVNGAILPVDGGVMAW